MGEVYFVIATFGTAFLVTMWGSFFLWRLFKKKDDARRVREHEILRIEKERRAQNAPQEHL